MIERIYKSHHILTDEPIYIVVRFYDDLKVGIPDRTL